MAGALLAAPTFAAFYQRAFAENDDRGGAATDLYWSVRDSPGVAIWASARRQISAARESDVRQVAGAPDAGDASRETVRDQRFYSVVAQWWWMTPIAGIPRLVGALGAVAMLLAGALLLGRSGPAPRRVGPGWLSSADRGHEPL